MATPLRFLRPYTLRPLATASPSRRSAYLSFYELARSTDVTAPCGRRGKQSTHTAGAVAVPTEEEGEGEGEEPYTAEEHSTSVANRIARLKRADGLRYPRASHRNKRVAVHDFVAAYNDKTEKELSALNGCVTMTGRVMHIRRFGSKFFFVHIRDNGRMLQVRVNWGKLEGSAGCPLPEFKKLGKMLSRGDFISVTGRPGRTETQELCLDAQSLPEITSFSLAPLPFHLPEASRMQQRHLDLVVNASSRDTLLARSRITRTLREYLQTSLRFIEVQTPILAANAGGALARPFETRATGFSGKKDLALRIAPELWLKRLVAGGLERVFEMGAAFRNEGLDATHNPEFTMCEFYAAHATLDDLMDMTMHLFQALAQDMQDFARTHDLQLVVPASETFAKANFQKLEFIPALQEALGCTLPDLASPNALADVLGLLERAGPHLQLQLQLSPGELTTTTTTLPKLLDHLATRLLEPRSAAAPLFLTHHPACMSPLAKAFACPATGQHVSARAELFYRGHELANMYEEENDPFEQRRKFVEQQGKNHQEQGEPPYVIDEQYIRVLESGLPPTGGWGCGVDRLVMLFTGAKRISDVLAFGSLRHVVGLASVGSQPTER